MAKIPSFHPGYPGSIPGQGIKILLHAPHSLLPLRDQFQGRVFIGKIWGGGVAAECVTFL